jgi:hypothetical protein
MRKQTIDEKTILKKFVLICLATFLFIGLLLLLSIVVLLLIRIFLPWMRLWQIVTFNSVFAFYCAWYIFAKKIREKSILIKIIEQIILGLWLIICIAYVLSNISQ